MRTNGAQRAAAAVTGLTVGRYGLGSICAQRLGRRTNPTHTARQPLRCDQCPSRRSHVQAANVAPAHARQRLRSVRRCARRRGSRCDASPGAAQRQDLGRCAAARCCSDPDRARAWPGKSARPGPIASPHSETARRAPCGGRRAVASHRYRSPAIATDRQRWQPGRRPGIRPYPRNNSDVSARPGRGISTFSNHLKTSDSLLCDGCILI